MGARTLTGPGGPASDLKPATNGAPAAELASELVPGKDRPPFGPELVRRRRLLDRLLRSPPARLVLLSAPAGDSKTGT
jgi:hypothetical protein